MDIYDLIGVHDLMNDSKNSVAEEIMQRFEQGEDLPEMAFKVVFEHLDYFQEISEDVEIIEKLMEAEIENKLPKLEAFRSNAEILAKIDITYLPSYPTVPAAEVGDFIRSKVAWYLKNKVS